MYFRQIEIPNRFFLDFGLWRHKKDYNDAALKNRKIIDQYSELFWIKYNMF